VLNMTVAKERLQAYVQEYAQAVQALGGNYEPVPLVEMNQKHQLLLSAVLAMCVTNCDDEGQQVTTYTAEDWLTCGGAEREFCVCAMDSIYDYMYGGGREHVTELSW